MTLPLAGCTRPWKREASEKQMAETDGQLVQRARAGEQEAFGALVDRYRDMVYGLGYHLTGDFEAARDLAQEAFLQAYVRLGQLREPERFAGWLRTIAENAHRSRQRHREVATVALEEDPELARESPTPSAIELTVREALERLPKPERLALTLHYVNGYSQAEIGAFLGVRAETVKTRLARARRSLREELLQMAEDVFHEHALPPEFREDVIKGVNRLMEGVRPTLPAGLAEVRERVESEGAAAMDRVISSLPAVWGKSFKEEQDLPPIRIGDLPPDFKADLFLALRDGWLECVLHVVTDLHKPFDQAHTCVRFLELEGRPAVCIATAPGAMPNRPFWGGGTAGYLDAQGIERVGGWSLFALDQGDDSTRQNHERESARLAREVVLTSLTDEVRHVLEGIAESVRVATGPLATSLGDEARRLFREIRDGLSGDVRGGVQAEAVIKASALPQHLAYSLRRAALLRWASGMLERVEYPPEYFGAFDEWSISFRRECDPDPPHRLRARLTLYRPDGRLHASWLEWVVAPEPENP